MKILFVVNNVYATGNGLSASARRTAEYLRAAGEEVRFLSGANPDPNGPQPDFLLGEFKVPVFDGLIRQHGYTFAARERDVIREAVRWADLVHLEEPFFLEMATARIAEEEGKPLTGTYHLHPENLYASIHMGWEKALNTTTLRLWRDAVFNKCLLVQCPTENVKERLVRYHFKPELRVISNGLLIEDRGEDADVDALIDPTARYHVLYIGRLSVEKDPFTLLRAMEFCRNRENLQLIFAGRGPIEDKVKAEAQALLDKGILTHTPSFAFLPIGKLQALARRADLYIHCATIEVEGLSCLEAIGTGLVPVIAKAKLSATSQFALSPKSIFPAGNAKALAARIDDWLDHDERRLREAERYKALPEQYAIEKSIAELRQMFSDALALHKERNAK